MILKAGVLNDCDFAYIRRQTEITTYGICVHCGSQDDVEGLSGTAHLLEHLIYNSSAAKAILKIGGAVNALTERQKTFYVCQLPLNNDVLFDQFLSYIKNPEFTSSDVQREKNNIISEHAKIHSHEMNIMVNGLYKLMFPDNGLRNPVIGDLVDIKNIGVDDLLYFHERHYHASGMIVMQIGPKINPQYLSNGSVFIHEYTKVKVYPKLNTSIPKFKWQVSPGGTPHLSYLR